MRYEGENMEIELIRFHKSYLYEFGYNRDMGGNSAEKISEASRVKMSNSKKGVKKSSEFCEMIRNLHKGNTYRKGAILSIDTKQKMSNAKIGKTYNARKIDQFTLNDEFVKTWNSILSIEKECGFNNSCIVNNLKGRSKSSYGFKWKYHE